MERRMRSSNWLKSRNPRNYQLFHVLRKTCERINPLNQREAVKPSKVKLKASRLRLNPVERCKASTRCQAEAMSIPALKWMSDPIVRAQGEAGPLGSRRERQVMLSHCAKK